MHDQGRPVPWRRAFVAGWLGLVLMAGAQAQFAMAPTPMHHDEIAPSAAASEREYRRDAARHVYASYPMNIFRGKLPPLMYAIAVTEIDVDENGVVTEVRLVREPAAAKEVGPWVLSLVRKVGRLPPPARLGKLTYTETWLVDKSGRFQVDTLSEGQRHE